MIPFRILRRSNWLKYVGINSMKHVEGAFYDLTKKCIVLAIKFPHFLFGQGRANATASPYSTAPSIDVKVNEFIIVKHPFESKMSFGPLWKCGNFTVIVGCCPLRIVLQNQLF